MKSPNLKKLLKASGLTQKFIAETFGVSNIYISYIFAGKRQAEALRGKIESLLIKQIQFNKKNAA